MIMMMSLAGYVDLAVIAIIGTIVVVALYGMRKYPICPKCNGNLNSTRTHFWGKEARCSKHGTFFTDGDKSPKWVTTDRFE
jgi:tRNA(Ile2) C34 agmatinyltransferase TiaS